MEEDFDPVTEPYVKVCKDPGCPTKEEMDNHYVKHLPFRAWCPVCVEARAVEDPHYKKKNEKYHGKPTVCMDYKSCGQSGDDEATKMQMIIMRDSGTIYSFFTYS